MLCRRLSFLTLRSPKTSETAARATGTDGKPVSQLAPTLAPDVLNRGPLLSIVGNTDPDHDLRAKGSRRVVSPDTVKEKRPLSSADNDRHESGRQDGY